MSRYAPLPPVITNQTVQPFGRGIVRVINTNTTFTIPSGIYKIRVHVLGAGGSGAALNMLYASNSIEGWFVSGGGGGGYAIKEIDVSYGDSFVCTIGVGGASVTSTSSNTVNGLSGGTTSFGSIVSATGGQGGKCFSILTSVTAITGGTGVGGDLNFNGGNGGTITWRDDLGFIASGGGAAGSSYGNGSSGVNLNNTSLGYSAIEIATGGGGADAVNSTIIPTNIRTGICGSGAGIVDPVGLVSVRSSRFSLSPNISTNLPANNLSSPAPYNLNGAGGYSNTTSAGDGAGGFGASLLNTSVSGYYINGGIFGGGGGLIFRNSTASQSVTSGTSLIGGGSGGCLTLNDFGSAISGVGGRGLIILEY